MAQPDMYSMELSLFVLEAGVKLLAQRRPDLLYLSLTDWVQHKYAPDESEARRFYQALDDAFGRLAALDATVALTADHGMSDKSNAAGEPNVIWLQDILDARFGAGTTTVICPITDAFVGHHGALGGFVRVWSRSAVTARQIIEHIAGVEGIEMALTREEACKMFDMPADREGDVAVVARQDVCIGSSAQGARPRGAQGPSPAHARRRVGDQGAVHPEPAAVGCVQAQGRGRHVEEPPDLRLCDQRHPLRREDETAPTLTAFAAPEGTRQWLGLPGATDMSKRTDHRGSPRGDAHRRRTRAAPTA